MTTDFNIAPTDLRDFLKAQGWTLIEDALRDRLYVLSNGKFSRRQLVFPMDVSAPDYSDSVGGVIEKVAEMNGDPIESLVAKVQSLKDDVLRLRIFFDGNDSSLPLGFAATVVQSTEKLLRAAACTVLKPRTHHPRLSLNEAAQLVEKSRFGQTENGSFILRVACPLHAMEVQGALELDENHAPFVRQVTLSLQKAIEDLTTAIEADTLDRLVSDLKSAEKPLVSSNLCEALSGMHDEQVANSLDVGFDWSALRPVASQLGRPIRIQRDYFSRIEEVRRELRAVERHQEDTFVGTVERLDGEMGDDGRRSGTVILSLLLPDEGETVRARTVLSADDYRKADQAHMTNGAYIQVAGRLLPGRQPRQLVNVSKFSLLT